MMSLKSQDDWNRVWQNRGRAYHEASIRFPEVHEREITLFKEGFELRPGMRLLEVAAAGGYLLMKIREEFGEAMDYLAIESAEIFSQFLPSYVKLIPESTITRFNLSDRSVDLVANLAGLHHTKNSRLYFEEGYRVLRPGGQIGIAEVRKGSAADAWLNTFVNAHNSEGHKGSFFERGELSEKLREAGFKNIREELKTYTWDFQNISEMVTFCRLLFGLDRASPETIQHGLREYLDYEEKAGGGIALNWELLHAFGDKND